jgi:hypothetical protein
MAGMSGTSCAPAMHRKKYRKLLATPTTKANRGTLSMQKWESCKSYTACFGLGPIHPMAWEWLMGFPLGWTDLEDSEML